MPILGIIASSKFGDVGDFESIATVSVGSGGAATVDFTSIPSTYTHLQLRYIARSDWANSKIDSLSIRINNDSATNYAYHLLSGNGATASAGAATSQTVIVGSVIPGDSYTSGMFGAGVIDLLDYTNTNKYKTLRTWWSRYK